MRERFAAVGMLEFTSIAAGMEAADRMIKAAEVFPVWFRTVCPGKYLACVTGDVAAVSASLEAGRSSVSPLVADWFLLPNIHPDVIAALCGTGQTSEREALGILETYSAASIIAASDAAVKAAEVRILDVRVALGIGGKGYALFGGDVAAVQAAVEAGARQAEEAGLLVAKVVIPRPAEAFFEQVI
ncbi:MAG: BMC domain-containing protein [Desulfovibrio sp.]|jgi:microcompartment protein CcmL/EutN|nr:BMC domain-containing protein [Desulfovibrio sp.]